MNEEKIIVCRCEDITLKEIRDLINDGYTTLEEIKRITRAVMGPCQGKTCGPIIAREISKITGKPIEEIYKPSIRPPFGGLFFKEIVGEKDEK
ncbi:(2Fe-2S)-binding protein [Marinitoga litoralis]|jgi:bacterioferritin-associated ferredoxin|uniref:(2Fe-2S)-binding protein n=1 Tax=Marinitoga litoralis TaxID=570855 RepID=UPI001960C96B|nr:(2Fe-2S)-binding protein [Marinitoga litoralis]MBM7558459.1 bacterioferritin-associated ferredoxin [Marinitoga litoralis]